MMARDRQPLLDDAVAPTVEPSLTEWVVMALLAEAPAHGFALARALAPGTDLGRVLTVRRPLVYRAIDRLTSAGLVEVHHYEPGAGGPTRTLHHLTATGRRALADWLTRPVDHVRDLRIEFLIKLRLIERSGRDSAGLVGAQQAALADTLHNLVAARADGDVVDRWRSHNARAVDAFLADLADAEDTAHRQAR